MVTTWSPDSGNYGFHSKRREGDFSHSARRGLFSTCFCYMCAQVSNMQVKTFTSQLRQNARIIDELDVALGLANLAAELRFVRPVIKDE